MATDPRMFIGMDDGTTPIAPPVNTFYRDWVPFDTQQQLWEWEQQKRAADRENEAIMDSRRQFQEMRGFEKARLSDTVKAIQAAQQFQGQRMLANAIASGEPEGEAYAKYAPMALRSMAGLGPIIAPRPFIRANQNAIYAISPDGSVVKQLVEAQPGSITFTNTPGGQEVAMLTQGNKNVGVQTIRPPREETDDVEERLKHEVNTAHYNLNSARSRADEMAVSLQVLGTNTLTQGDLDPTKKWSRDATLKVAEKAVAEAEEKLANYQAAQKAARDAAKERAGVTNATPFRLMSTNQTITAPVTNAAIPAVTNAVTAPTNTTPGTNAVSATNRVPIRTAFNLQPHEEAREYNGRIAIFNRLTHRFIRYAN